MKKKALLPIGLGVLLMALVPVLVFYKDMTGQPYSEIEAYRAANTYKYIHYTVTVDGGKEPLKLSERSEAVTLTTQAQVSSLLQQAEYLQQLTAISFEDIAPQTGDLMRLTEAFPRAQLHYSRLGLLGKEYDLDITELDLSHVTAGDMDALQFALPLLPRLTRVTLNAPDTLSALTLDDVAALYELRPDIRFEYCLELFGQILSTDMERVEYFQTHIGDEGLPRFRKLLPLMYNLTYLKLDWCGTSDEAMAQLREDYKDTVKVVWRVFMGETHNLLTDSLKVWATWNINNEEAKVLRYCTDLKYLDLGHNSITDLDFMETLTELEMVILYPGVLRDISGIRNCTKIEYLELFTSLQLDDEDMQHLAGLTKMKHLNISNLPRVKSLAFTDNMPDLKRLWATMTAVPYAEGQRVRELHPDMKFIFLYGGEPTDHGWRHGIGPGGRDYTYLLVRARFGYDTWDYSCYPKGYLTEEITYETLGFEEP